MWPFSKRQTTTKGSSTQRLEDEPTQTHVVKETYCASLLNHLKQVRDNIPHIPAEFERTAEGFAKLAEWSGRFHPNHFVEAFPRLHLEPGYVLDFTYYFWGDGGFPLLYARRNSELRLKTADAFAARFGRHASDAQPFWSHVTFDGTPEGAFEFLLFCWEAPRFYLHGQNLADDEIPVCLRRQREDLFRRIPVGDPESPRFQQGMMSADDRHAIMQVSLEPTVTVQGHSYHIQFISFTAHGGFFNRSALLRLPNRFEWRERESIAECHIGPRF